jgi:hypothetical protein
MIFPISSQVARIAGMYFHTFLICLDGVLLTLCYPTGVIQTVILLMSASPQVGITVGAICLCKLWQIFYGIICSNKLQSYSLHFCRRQLQVLELLTWPQIPYMHLSQGNRRWWPRLKLQESRTKSAIVRSLHYSKRSSALSLCLKSIMPVLLWINCLSIPFFFLNRSCCISHAFLIVVYSEHFSGR